MTQKAGSQPDGPPSEPRNAPVLARGCRSDHTARNMAVRSLRKFVSARQEASIPCKTPGMDMLPITRSLPWKSSGRTRIRTKRAVTSRTRAARVADQPWKVVSRCSPRSRKSSTTDHRSPSSVTIQPRISPRTAPDVLMSTHTLGADSWPTSLTYPEVNRAARRSKMDP